MAKIVCATSKLRADMRISDLTLGARICIHCDLGIEETAFQLVMQCPANEECKCKMFNEIHNISNEMREEFSKSRGDEISSPLWAGIWLPSVQKIC